MRPFRDLSIHKKLTLAIIGTSVSVLVLSSAAFFINDIGAYIKAKVQDNTSIAEILSANSVAALSFGDSKAAEEMLQTLKVKEHVTSAFIATRDSRLFASFSREGGAAETEFLQTSGKEGHRFERNRLVIVTPILSNNEKIGTVRILLDLKEIYSRLLRYAILVAVILLFSFFLVLFISSRIGKVISKPILDLADIAKNISEKSDYSVRATKQSGDEIGQLTEAFNQMLTEIQRQNDALQQMNKELENRVEERTRKILETQRFLDSIIENIPNMIFIKAAKDLRFIRLNKAGEELVGYSQKDFVGKTDYDFFPKVEADSFTRKDREVLSAGRVKDIPEETIHTKHGEKLLHTKKVPVYNENGQPLYLLGISEDITEHKKAEQLLIQKKEELAHSKAELEQLEIFAYVATHDLQEPLRKIIFFSDILFTKNAPDLNEESRGYLGRIKSATVRMSQMIADLREFSRVGSTGQPFEKNSLKEVIRDALLDFDLKIKETGGRVEIGELPVIRADRLQMRQLFQNLIANALKFHRQGVSPRVVIQSKVLDAGFFEITVEDNGIGFDEKYLDRIFKPFQRLHGKSEYSGSGIGLAICQKIVARHDGKITAKSTPGQGSTFIITLPA